MSHEDILNCYLTAENLIEGKDEKVEAQIQSIVIGLKFNSSKISYSDINFLINPFPKYRITGHYYQASNSILSAFF